MADVLSILGFWESDICLGNEENSSKAKLVQIVVFVWGTFFSDIIFLSTGSNLIKTKAVFDNHFVQTTNT